MDLEGKSAQKLKAIRQYFAIATLYNAMGINNFTISLACCSDRTNNSLCLNYNR